MEKKCPRCGGRGFIGAGDGLPKDTPTMLIPIGVRPCPICHRSGKIEELDIEECKRLIGQLPAEGAEEKQ